MDRVSKREKLRWSGNEEEALVRNYSELSREELLLILPDRTWGAIKHKASALGLTDKRIQKAWTAQELNTLKKNIKSNNLDSISNFLPNRTKASIVAKAARLHLLQNA